MFAVTNNNKIVIRYGKAFDDNERKLIKDKLKEGALLFIQQQGVRKTSVDELVKYANISKGAFYLFYTSKELLFSIR